MKFKISILVAAILCATSSQAQGTLEDYNRSYALANKLSSIHIDNARLSPRWIDGTDKFWYVNEDNGKYVYTLVDAGTRKSAPMFNHVALARHLSEQAGNAVSPDNLGISNTTANAAVDSLWFNFDGKRWAYATKGKGSLSCLGPLPAPAPTPHWMVVDEEKDGEPVISPDGNSAAFVRDNNVWVRDLSTHAERQLTTDGTIGNYYSSWIHWSPDGSKIALNRIRPAEKRYVYYVESSPAPGSQPALHKQEYAKPGDELRYKCPVIIDVNDGCRLVPDTKLFDKQYDIIGPQWNADSKGITFEYNERGHKTYRVLEMSATDASVRPLVEETHDKYINWLRTYRYMLSDGLRIIWSSERDNTNQLYMYDRVSGLPTHQITTGPRYLRSVINVDEANEKIYFSANDTESGLDPYFIRYYSINFDGTDLIDLTPEPGNHTAVFSPDFKYLVDTWSSVSEPPVTVLRDASDGSEIMKIAQADITPLVTAGWCAPEVFAAPGRDCETQMWGVIYRPSNFDPEKKYPVIEYIYQGPGDQYVPKSFVGFNRNMGALAELGFVVVMVDGMGTSFRTREFENVCYKNLVDAGLPDHIAWIKAAAAKYPWIDVDRVGIYGASAGGQEAMTAVLHYPEFYKAAYSACGCHDNRMDKIWWNEQWLGYPIDESYSEASNVDNAHMLSRPLMLVVGEIDDNVDPASTMQVADALIKANKDFELVVLPGVRHTLGETYGEHKRYDFFVRHLLGVTPPAWHEITY